MALGMAQSARRQRPQSSLIILLLHGPNLNLLGRRDPRVYGSVTLAQVDERMKAAAKSRQATLTALQSNSEGVLIDAVHNAADGAHGIVINPGAFGHYSYALRDAIESVALPTIEVHLSNVHAREAWRRHSVLSDVVVGSICGLGWRSYLCGVESLIDLIRERRGSPSSAT